MTSSNPVRTAQILFVLNATIWLMFGITGLVNLQTNPIVPAFLKWMIPVLMFGNAGAMFLSGFGLGKKNRWFYYLALTVLGMNILLSLTDQVGIWDWMTLIIDVIILIFVIQTRKAYQ